MEISPTLERTPDALTKIRPLSRFGKDRSLVDARRPFVHPSTHSPSFACTAVPVRSLYAGVMLASWSSSRIERCCWSSFRLAIVMADLWRLGEGRLCAIQTTPRSMVDLAAAATTRGRTYTRCYSGLLQSVCLRGGLEQEMPGVLSLVERLDLSSSSTSSSDGLIRREGVLMVQQKTTTR